MQQHSDINPSSSPTAALPGKPSGTTTAEETGPRARQRSSWPEWSAVALFSAIVAYAIPYHEPFVDEAQAWQMARSLSLPQLFVTYVRYEGSPGLWHFILWLLIRAHVTYAGLHWICGGVAVAAASIFILQSPFPRYLKLVLPFTYFLVFQYAVVARSYALAPLLLFLLAWRWKRGPLGIALILGLLANVSLHCAVLSGGLATVYAFELWRERAERPGSRYAGVFSSTLLLLAFYGFALWTAWPAHDLIISRVRGEDRPVVLYAISSVVIGICQPWILSVPFWIAISLWFHARRSLVYLLPVLLFAIFSGAVHFEWWHAGLLVPTLLSLLWISWPAAREPNSGYGLYGRFALLLMAATQLLWSGYAILYDHEHAYSPDLAAAKFLEPFVQEGAEIVVTYVDNPYIHAYTGVGVLPYFNRNIYANQQLAFWLWSASNPTEAQFNALLPSHPPIVLVERTFYDGQAIDLKNSKLQMLFKEGYRLSNVFCGTMPLRLGNGLTSCHMIFQRLDASAGSGAAQHALSDAAKLHRWEAGGA